MKTSEMVHRRIELSTHGKGSQGHAQGMKVIQHVGCDCRLCNNERARIEDAQKEEASA
jgi:hypothetical protein